MRIVFIPDPHLTPDRLDEAEWAFREIERATLMAVQEPPLYVLLGDNFDSPRINYTVSEFLFHKVRKWLKSKASVIVCIGNAGHDPNNPSGDVYSLMQCLAPEPLLTIVRDTYSFQHEGFSMLCVSHSAAHTPEWWRQQRVDGHPIVCGHFSIDSLFGASAGNLPEDMLGRGDGVQFIAGHYHKPCEVHNLLHAGSLLPVDFGEDGGKRFAEYDTHTRCVTTHPLPCNAMYTVTISTPEAVRALESDGNINYKLILDKPVDEAILRQEIEARGLRVLRVERTVQAPSLTKADMTSMPELDLEAALDMHISRCAESGRELLCTKAEMLEQLRKAGV